MHSRLGMQDAGSLATAMLEHQGLTGQVRRASAEDGTRINDGTYSSRNPATSVALPDDRLARASVALAM
ncbi:hypothetical protein [Kitasatospora sp. NPDC017646]|uniref:hypothetical protein n=1 Tax=Kitasatospora sp. NPDC017646 TaxID=3364024 RepID=UPI0037AC7798